ncbi:MAG: hydantoinase B/oxoprolinase family protein, partial [Alphaproteobacteria bacterium]|nr:hydantoinase B/oxoprolinase family protein [Alphaproteobacteria bacterium]
MVREYEVLEGEIAFSHRGERHFTAPQGAHGAAPAAGTHSEIRRTGGATEVTPSKLVTKLQKSDRVVVETGGGG